MGKVAFEKYLLILHTIAKIMRVSWEAYLDIIYGGCGIVGILLGGLVCLCVSLPIIRDR